jgi:glycosyltransferase involved in cell wall biosynthesis
MQAVFMFWQGVDVLLHAFARLVKKFPNCRLLIVGGQDEPNKDAYKRLAHELRITDHAIFVPFVPYEQSALYIAAADVCVAPYVPVIVNWWRFTAETLRLPFLWATCRAFRLRRICGRRSGAGKRGWFVGAAG